MKHLRFCSMQKDANPVHYFFKQDYLQDNIWRQGRDGCEVWEVCNARVRDAPVMANSRDR